MSAFAPRARALTLAGLLAVLLAVGCSSPTGSSVSLGGNTPTPTPTAAPWKNTGLRALPADFSTRKAVCYSGYRGATTGTVPTKANIDQDLTLLNSAGYNLLRLYSIGTDGSTQMVLQEIAALNLDMKVQLGIWISGPKAKADSANQQEITGGTALAKQFPSIVETVSVGNETMVSWGMGVPAADMAGYLSQVRAAVTQPVTTDDNWAFFADSDGTTTGGPGTGKYQTASILAVIDYISMHTYAFSDAQYNLWNWEQAAVPVSGRAAAMMTAAVGVAQANYVAIQAYANTQGFGNLPITIGETGWKSTSTDGGNDPVEYDMAHPVNQALYLAGLATWTNGPKAIFYFEGFDEPWKAGDDGWGVFDVNRLGKYALYNLLPAANCETTVYTPADALYDIPAVSNGTIQAPTYQVYADTLPAASTVTVAVPSGPILPLTKWIGWDNPWTATGTEVTASGSDTASAGFTKYMAVTPTPHAAPNNWGWGFFLNLGNPEDLSKFSKGHLHFSVRTTYPGKLEAGFYTGDPAAKQGCDIYTQLAVNGPEGYVNDGAWHDVSIPITGLVAKGVPGSGQNSTAKVNLSQVTQPFVIADRYAKTGNTPGSLIPVDIDNVYWTQN